MIDIDYIDYIRFFDTTEKAEEYASELREHNNGVFRVLPHESQFYVEQDIP